MNRKYKFFRFILGILGISTTPAILILAMTNPMLKEFEMFLGLCSIWVLLLSLFMAESFFMGSNG